MTPNFAKMRAIPFLLLVINLNTQAQNDAVRITGAMRNTLHNGKVEALIHMDTMVAPVVFGLGPLAFLRGELLVFDGIPYLATATGDSMHMREEGDVGAPFFVHQRVENWTIVDNPDSVVDIKSLNGFLTLRFSDLGTPLTSN